MLLRILWKSFTINCMEICDFTILKINSCINLGLCKMRYYWYSKFILINHIRRFSLPVSYDISSNLDDIKQW